MTQRPVRLSTRGLRDRLGDGRTQLVDVRPIDAYNGWRLDGEVRGGHVRGARALPSTWSAYLDWIEIVRAKRLQPGQPLVAYGTSENETEAVARLFGRAGFEDVGVYHDFREEWCTDATLPMDHLARYTQLVPPGWLHRRASRGRAPEGGEGRLVVCHAHYRNRGDYEEGHIPGAVALDTELLESPQSWNRRTPDEVREALLALGVTSDTTVVLYGRFSLPNPRDPFPGSSAGQLAAFRCGFIMLWAGVRDVRILNGGFHSWVDAGLPVTVEDEEPHPADDFGAEVPGAPELAVDLPEARDILRSSGAHLVCVRSRPEYIGAVSGYNYITKKGRIPGSVFADCGSDAYHMENYRNLDHTTREFGEIAASWREAGITPDKHNAFYCGTGWRGSEAFFNAWLMGWPRVSVFDGGWFEWSRDDANPFEVGDPAHRAP